MVTVSLFDTLTGRDRPLSCLEPGHVRLYVCGPTTYDDAHIGHARPCIVYDVLVRHLRSQGLRVTYVRNVTDVDDKIINRANERGEEPAVLSARMLASYLTDMARLGNLEPDHQPKVSEHLPEIRDLITRLVERGHAYEVEGDVYFEVATCKEYGKLSHRNLSELEAGASERVNEAEQEKKRHAYDFALWKGAKAGEPHWPSPWGPGRPGWHIECSAMSMRYLGETFDLHGGGLDLVFPHHENEIAQSECATGHVLARHWMHNGFVVVNKEKMSKSLGNFFRLREAFERSEPESVRYALLTVHYRSPFHLEMELGSGGELLSFPQFRDAEGRLEYLYSTKLRLMTLAEARITTSTAPAPAEVSEFGARLAAALNDDLNTAEAVAHLAGLLKAINELVDSALAKKGTMSRTAYDQACLALGQASTVLGLGQDEPQAFLNRVRGRRAAELGLDEAWVLDRILARASARGAKDFALADDVRKELAQRGVELLDSPEGTDWRLAIR
jgi:cysteinyl-tRNA synthetase